MIQLFNKGAYVFNGNRVVAEEAIGAEYKKYMEQILRTFYSKGS